MREDGVDLESLEQTLARPEVAAFYTMPTFHNPLGTTTSTQHRRRVLEIARSLVFFWDTEDWHDAFFGPSAHLYLRPGDTVLMWAEGLGAQLLNVTTADDP